MTTIAANAWALWNGGAGGDNGLADLAVTEPQVFTAYWNAYPATYSGDCLSIERASDLATQEIGFDSNGIVDVAAIASFCGASDGRIFLWYDQLSGNDGAGGYAAAGRPKIYDGATGQMVVNADGVIAWEFGLAARVELREVVASSEFVFATNFSTTDTLFVMLGDPSNTRYIGVGQSGSTSTLVVSDSGSFSVGGPYFKDGVEQTIANRGDIYTAFATGSPINCVITGSRTNLGFPLVGVYDNNAGHSSSINNGFCAGYLAHWTAELAQSEVTAFNTYVDDRMAAVAAAVTAAGL